MVMMDGKPLYRCSICGALIHSNVVCVSHKTSKNRLGRIAWGRDAICDKCLRKENKEKQNA